MRQNGVRSNVRFPYASGMKKGGKAKNKVTKIEKTNLSAQDVEKNLLRNNLSKTDVTSPTENGANVKEARSIDNAPVF